MRAPGGAHRGWDPGGLFLVRAATLAHHAAKCRLQNAKCRIRKAVSFQLSAVSRNAAAYETSLPLAGFDSDAYGFTAYGSEQCVFQRDATWKHRHE